MRIPAGRHARWGTTLKSHHMHAAALVGVLLLCLAQASHAFIPLLSPCQQSATGRMCPAVSRRLPLLNKPVFCLWELSLSSLAKQSSSSDGETSSEAGPVRGRKWVIKRGSEVREIERVKRDRADIGRRKSFREGAPGARRDDSSEGGMVGPGGSGGAGGRVGDRNRISATREQIRLNQEIASALRPDDVFNSIMKARNAGVQLNSVNLATALHRVARTGTPADFRRLNGNDVYELLLGLVRGMLLDPQNQFCPRELGNMAWGVAKAQIFSIETFMAIHTAIMRVGLEEFKPQELANTVWAFATLHNLAATPEEEVQISEIVSGVAELVEAEFMRRDKEAGGTDGTLEQFKPQELSNSLWALATVKRWNADVFSILETEILRRGLKDFVSQDLANTAWSFVNTGLPAPNLYKAVEEEVLHRGVESFKNQEMVSLIWTFAKADLNASDLLALVSKEVSQRNMATFQTQELSNLVWAFATCGIKDDNVFRIVGQEVVGRGLAEFKNQEVANTVWSFAKVAFDSPALFDVVESEILHRRVLPTFIPQELSNLLWAYAKLGYGSTRLYEKMSDEMIRRGLNNFKTQELSNAVWAHATAGKPMPELSLAVEEEALRRGLDSFTPQDLANMMWAFAKGDHVASLLFEDFKAQFDKIINGEKGLSAFKPQELSNFLWASAKTQHSVKGLFNLAEEHARELLMEAQADAREDEDAGEEGSMVPMEVSEEIWQYAVIGKHAEMMFETIEAELLERDLHKFSTQHLANMAWAYVVLEHSRFNKLSNSGRRLLAKLLQVVESRIDEFGIEELRQLGQVMLATRERQDHEFGLAKKIKDALKREHADIASPDSSEFHKAVSAAIMRLGAPVTDEVKVFEGVYHIDIVIGEGDPEEPAGKIAVEVDGPTHFVYNTEQPTPHTALKRWLLEREGYVVLPIPYFEWARMTGEGAGVYDKYMHQKLEGLGWDFEMHRVEESKRRKMYNF